MCQGWQILLGLSSDLVNLRNDNRLYCHSVLALANQHQKAPDIIQSMGRAMCGAAFQAAMTAFKQACLPEQKRHAARKPSLPAESPLHNYLYWTVLETAGSATIFSISVLR